LWSLDLFRCESAILHTHWVLVVMDQCTRRIVGFGVHRGVVDGVALCQMFNRAIGRQPGPTYLSSDHDPLYRFHQWQANLRILDVEAIKTVPYAPLSHPFVERLIGTIRREYLDRVLFWTAADLEMKLLDFQRYFNGHRTHAGLGGRIPEPRFGEDSARASVNGYRWPVHCRGLYQTPMRHDRVRRRLEPIRHARDADRLNARRVLVPDRSLATIPIWAGLNHRSHGSFRRLCGTTGNSPPTRRAPWVPPG
jgi:putative transposase